ncbi:ATP-dependent helicase [Succinivibrio dextrinosolvens]|uniref:DNA 3'-5' helicase n=1 Tax=Succinivibrio dextrinosolvens TaxID=83771 RepID=A0A662Z9Q7_9GAMM|nr:UvrD-helicase domain-containing protein [Succinivibrio dextrinosolvens]SFK14427.1 ATP-dependent DNA helicase Rep [Succinivibrio dextrinosolvens]
MRLNDAQQAAVDYISGPCLVLAGAGSGKTRVITTKIVKLIHSYNIPPQNICAVTFTNKAAAEMRDRVKKELGNEIASKITISTFHSLGLTILKNEYLEMGLSKNFTLFDQYDSLKVIRDIVREKYPQILVDNSEKNVVEEIASMISNWKTNLQRPEDIEDRTVRVEIYDDYQEYLKACNAADFEDLIFKTTLLLRDNDRVREKYTKLFRYVLVDEYQDTNETQYQLLKCLTSHYKTFTVVGDDDQSIYAWRGARPENIKVLAHEFPDLKVIKLEQNYRSTMHILNCANTLISHNEHIFNKTLFTNSSEGEMVKIMELRTEADEADRVVQLILAHQFRNHTEWKDYAVLYRSNGQSKMLEKAFHSARIPCFISGGTSFFEQVEIKDMLSWCRVICNPFDDMALLRVINVPRRGIGAETINYLFTKAKESGKSLYETALNPNISNDMIPRQKKSMTEFMVLLTKMRSLILSKKDLELAENLVELIGYNAYIKANTESKIAVEIKTNNIKQLMTWITDLIRGKKNGDTLSFVEAVDRLGLREMMDRNNDDQDNDAVQMMTLHASKGLEFPYVYLVGMEEGCLPHKNSLPSDDNPDVDNVDEERRLAYVGITRARKELTMLLARETSSRRGIPTAISPSRFLRELPAADIEYYSLGETPSISEDQYKSDFDEALRQLDEIL